LSEKESEDKKEDERQKEKFEVEKSSTVAKTTQR
jgi:hypothetical protein